MTAHQPPLRPLLRRAVRFLAPRATPIGAILALALVATGLNAAEPLVLKRIFDGLAGGARHELAVGVATLVVLALLREAGAAASTWLTWRTRLRVQYALTEQTVSALHGLPIAFHRSEPVGAVMTRLDRNTRAS